MTTRKHNAPPLVQRTILIAVFTFALLTNASFKSIAAVESVDAERIRAVLGAVPTPPYQIHGICLGTTNDARRNLFITDPSLPKRITVSFSLWVIVGGGRVILVDTGFTNRKMIEKWRIKNYRHPVTALKESGFHQKQITDLIITHGHWDHIGGLHLFEPKRVWINKRVFGRLNKRERIHRLLLKAHRTGRLNVTRRIRTVAPGIAVVPVGLHAPGFQYVVVKTPKGIWILSSDIAPLFANFSRSIPSGQTSSPKATLRIQKTILTLTGGDVNHIIPGHEPSIYKATPHAVFGP